MRWLRNVGSPSGVSCQRWLGDHGGGELREFALALAQRRVGLLSVIDVEGGAVTVCD